MDEYTWGARVSVIEETLKIPIGGNDGDQKKNHREKPNHIKTNKYTLLTFLPLNMLEQFRRIANVYFLVMTIASFLIDSPVSPMTALVPLLFVIIVTAVKQAYEDFLRHKSDNKVNSTKVTIITKGVKKQIQSQYVGPGDLLFIERDCDVPCDLVLLCSSDPRGKCFVTTANLDGESNLKTLLVPKELPIVDFENINNFGIIECEKPQTDLYSFNGKIILPNGSLPLTSENILLRGSRLKNTEWVIGCAIYTGMCTKLQLNSRLTRNKFASSEIYLNRFLVFIVILMVVIVTLLYFLKSEIELSVASSIAYLGFPIDVYNLKQFFQDYVSFLVLFKYLIPISMYVTIELYRVMAGQFIRWDVQLYDDTIDEPCMVNTTNLNEELGQINILFSDKTGTLTKNEMILQQCSIGGRKYLYKGSYLEEEGKPHVVDLNHFEESHKNFFQALSICHTVQVVGNLNDDEQLEFMTVGKDNENLLERKKELNFFIGPDPIIPKETLVSQETQIRAKEQNFLEKASTMLNKTEEIIKNLDYQASSADEKALVEACAHLGFLYIGDDNEILKMRMLTTSADSHLPHDLHFQRLHVLEFTSERKRMSVIVKDKNDIKWIYTKGAESCVFPLCDQQSMEMITKTNSHIMDFAKQGLRTLAIARRKIDDDEYEHFAMEIQKASLSLDNRKALSEKCYAILENNLELLGATAVEDALQDDVAETLKALQKAGMKTWVLTGDKMETALNIAVSCGHIKFNAYRYTICECRNKEDILTHLNRLENEINLGKYEEFALLIDGESLTVALEETPQEFRNLSIKCSAVLCCRLSPLQKSHVVSLIKNGKENYITAAIGDGANDVSMLQEAHVGIAVMGKEGRQAAQCSDFAIGKFCMLQRLLLVHGHYQTNRLSLLLLYFFYKNTFLMGIVFIFQFYTMFSTTAPFDSLPLTLFNVIYATLPILFLSLTDKPYKEEELMRNPELYRKNTNNKQLQWPSFFEWIFFGVYHAIICFYFASQIFATNDVIVNGGQTADFALYCALLMHIVVIVVNLKIWLESQYITYWYIGTIIISILCYFVTSFLYNFWNHHKDTNIYGAYNKLLSSIPVWLYCIIATVACLLPDYTVRVLRQTFKFSRVNKNVCQS
ncbi:phospholipid-transporting ATPase IF-like [Musca autumnalis]|uniref:phospholipid-transporting ATPase IF-like n=1 Tax=Musca autumnalis TaxID=221902 RepID=UPI003CEA38E6